MSRMPDMCERFDRYGLKVVQALFLSFLFYHTHKPILCFDCLFEIVDAVKSWLHLLGLFIVKHIRAFNGV